jgi:hypothetical protein
LHLNWFPGTPLRINEDYISWGKKGV